VIRVFPAWPGDWDAAFQLLARRGFLVTSSMHSGSIEFVEILSQIGGECRVRNPWKDVPVTLHRNGRKAEDLSGSLLKFETARGETVVVVQRDSEPEQFRRKLPDTAGPSN
jgi:hypothetical protein